jgi:hypothetical protein
VVLVVLVYSLVDDVSLLLCMGEIKQQRDYLGDKQKLYERENES